MGEALDKYKLEQNAGLTRLSDIEPSPPQFFMFPYLRFANWNLWRGNGSTGKTSAVNSLIAAVTTTKAPSNFLGKLSIEEPRNCVYLGREDGLHEYAYYLENAHADRSRVLMVGNMSITLGDFSAIEKVFQVHRPALLVVDPIQAFLPIGVDSNKSNEIRPILDGVGALGEKYGVTLLMLEHLNKSNKQANEYRGSGTMDFYNRARSVMFFGFTPEGERCCAHLKSNGAAPGPTMIFHIDNNGTLVWDYEDITLNAGEVLATKPRRRAARAVDPCVQLALALVAQTGSWIGSASDAVAQAARFGIAAEISATAFGKRVRLGNIRGVKVTEDRRRDGRRLILERCDNDGGYQPTLP